MKESIKFVDSVSTPNDYVELNVQPKPKKRILRLRKLDIIDIFMIPITICAAVSIGFLIYQLTKAGANLSEFAGVIGTFIK